MEMLFEKIGTGNKYLRRIDSVEYLRKSDFNGEYWPYLRDEVAYVYENERGYHTNSADRIVEVDETEVVNVVGRLYKWKGVHGNNEA